MRIALLENNDNERMALCELLASHKILATPYGSAYHLIGNVEFHFDLLITDHKLDGVLTGVDVAQALRRNNPKCIIIVYTGYDTADIMELYRTMDVTCIISKRQKEALDALIMEVEKVIREHSRSRINKMMSFLSKLLWKLVGK